MTPLEIKILLHCSMSREPYPEEKDCNLSVKAAIARLKKNGLLIDGFTASTIYGPVAAALNKYYRVAERGRALVILLCSTEFPEPTTTRLKGQHATGPSESYNFDI